MGRTGLVTPIWDVLAPQGEQERALNRLTMHSRSLAFQIRQVVPVALCSGSVLLLGSLGTVLCTGAFTFIAVCNNVGEPAFLGPNQKFENQLPQAS